MIRVQQLQKLYYDRKLSMWDVAKTMSITPRTVEYWMDKHNLRRRSGSESAYVKQNPNGDPFKIKNKLAKKDKELLLAGLMLYWAEGSRKNKHVIQMANLDYRLILLFIKFLRRICDVKEEKICLNIQLYRKFNKEETKNYWSRILKVSKRFIAVNIHSDTRSKPEKQWSKYGIARIEVRNVKLKQWIDKELEKQIGKWN